MGAQAAHHRHRGWQGCLPGAPDLLDHDFTAVVPTVRGADFTYVLVEIAIRDAVVVIASRGPSWLACGHPRW